MSEVLIGIGEVAENLGVSRRTVDRAVATKALPSLKIGRRRLVRDEAISAWIKALESVRNSTAQI
jgi:excisionase family DNA binding protein